MKWEGNNRVKPWDYRVTVTFPCLDNWEDIQLIVELWRLQTLRPYITIVDTGSKPENLERILALRAEDVEVHSLKTNGVLHPCDLPAIANNLATSLCRTKYQLFTHSDVFPRSRTVVEELVGLCREKSPVVGYQMTWPRPYETDKRWVGHQLTMMDMDVMLKDVGLDWNQRRLCLLFGFDSQNVPHPYNKWFPDTELLFNMQAVKAGVEPYHIGQERYGGVYVDDRIEHVRALTNSQNYLTDFHQTYWKQAKEWAKEARERAKQRLEEWRKFEAPKPKMSVITAVSRPDNLEIILRNLVTLNPYFEWQWVCAVDTTAIQVNDILVRPHYVLAVPESSLGAPQKNKAIEVVPDDHWVFYLDDDNLLHPDFPQVMRHYIDQYPEKKGFIYNQVWADGRPRINPGQTKTVEYRWIDTASFVIKRSIIGDAKWVQYENERCNDWPFIRDVYENNKEHFHFINRALSVWNGLTGERQGSPPTVVNGAKWAQVSAALLQQKEPVPALKA